VPNKMNFLASKFDRPLPHAANNRWLSSLFRVPFRREQRDSRALCGSFHPFKRGRIAMS
jgi:hypothetical protein